ncbi:MAG: PIN domain-containing protein [Candidatus Micrarchaeia archaeon]
MMVLDTSFLFSLFHPLDVNHAKALEIFEKHRNEEMLITDSILFETLTVLNRKLGMDAARAAYEQLLSNSRLQVHYLTEDQRKENLSEFLKQKGRLSTADISVMQACKTALAEPLAFDKDLLRQIG